MDFEGIIAIIGFFGVVPAIVWAVSAYRHKSMKAATEVMKAMVERGDTLTPETIKALGVRQKRKHGDLRLGLILIAISIATFALGVVIPDEEANAAFGAIAMFPFLVGLVYVGLWVFIGRKNPED